MICTECKNTIQDSAQYCKYCGAKIIQINKQVSIQKRKKVINKNAILSLVFAIIGLIGCGLPLSIGWYLLAGIALSAGISLLFREFGKHEMYTAYDQYGIAAGKILLKVDFAISVLCLMLAASSITRFM